MVRMASGMAERIRSSSLRSALAHKAKVQVGLFNLQALGQKFDANQPLKFAYATLAASVSSHPSRRTHAWPKRRLNMMMMGGKRGDED